MRVFYLSVAQVRNSWNQLFIELKKWELFRKEVQIFKT